MITKDKINNLTQITNRIIGNSDDEKVRKCGEIFNILITNIDCLLDEVEWLKEENESLRFEVSDKKFEESPQRRTRNTRNQTLDFGGHPF